MSYFCQKCQKWGSPTSFQKEGVWETNFILKNFEYSAWSTNVLKRELALRMQAPENFLPEITVPFDFLRGTCTTKLPSIASRICWIILLCKYKNHTSDYCFVTGPKTILMKMRLICKNEPAGGPELISHLDSFWYRGKRQFGNGLINFKGGKFLKKLWCCVSVSFWQDNLVLSTELTM